VLSTNNVLNATLADSSFNAAVDLRDGAGANLNGASPL
jgi:hypothetical protein